MSSNQDVSSQDLRYSELLRGLLIADPLQYPKDKIASLLNQSSDILDFLFHSSPLNGVVSLPAKSKDSLSTEEVFIQLISLTLNLSTSLSSKLWTYCKARYDDDGSYQLSAKLTLRNVCPLLIQLQRAYHDLRDTCWILLLELFRIDQDDNHVYNNEVQKFVNQMMKSSSSDSQTSALHYNKHNYHLGRPETVLATTSSHKKASATGVDIFYEHIKNLYQWDAHFLSPKSFRLILSDAEVNAIDHHIQDHIISFSLQLAKSTAEAVVRELESSLDTVLLICYSRHTMRTADLEQLIHMTDAYAWTIPSNAVVHIAQSSHHIDANETLQVTQSRIQAKFVILFAENLQFWRTISYEDSSAHLLLSQGHPLWENINSSQLIQSTKPLRRFFTSSKERARNIPGMIIALFFGIFIRSSSHTREGNREYADISRELIEYALQYGVIDHLMTLVTPLLHTHDANSESINLYATILFEVANLLVAHVTLFDPNTLTQLDPILQMLHILCSIQPDLSDAFWKSWQYSCDKKSGMSWNDVILSSNESDYFVNPLTRLMFQLWKKSFHIPVYFFQFLASMVHSSAAAEMALSLLHEEISLISDSISSQQLLFISGDGLQHVTWEEISAEEGEHALLERIKRHRLVVQCNLASSAISLTQPMAGHRGIVLAVHHHNDETAFMIQWHEQYRIMWWSLIIEVMMTSFKSNTHLNNDHMVSLSSAVFKLLKKLLMTSYAKTYLSLDMKVDAWCLFVFLGEIGCSQYYVDMSARSVGLKNIRSHPDICLHIMTQELAMPMSTAQFIIHRVMLVDSYTIGLPAYALSNLFSSQYQDFSLIDKLDLMIEVTRLGNASWCNQLLHGLQVRFQDMDMSAWFVNMMNMKDKSVMFRWNRLYRELLIRLLYHETFQRQHEEILSRSSRQLISMLMANLVDCYVYVMNSNDPAYSNELLEYFKCFHVVTTEGRAKHSHIYTSFMQQVSSSAVYDALSTRWLLLILQPATMTMMMLHQQQSDHCLQNDAHSYASMPYEELAMKSLDMEISSYALLLLNELLNQSSSSSTFQQHVLAFYQASSKPSPVSRTLMSNDNRVSSNFVLFTSLLQISYKLKRDATDSMIEQYMIAVLHMIEYIFVAFHDKHDSILSCLSNYESDREYFLFLCVEMLLQPISTHMKAKVLDLFIVCARHQPLFLSELFHVSSSSVSTSSSTVISSADKAYAQESGMLRWCLLVMLAQTEVLYSHHPILLHKLLQFLYELTAMFPYHEIVSSFAQLSMVVKFWDWIGYAIMQDLEADVDLKANADNISDEVDRKVERRCHQLRCHELSLLMLAWERYLQHTSTSNPWSRALMNAHSKVDALLLRANESHRFLFWMKKYGTATIDASQVKELEQLLSSQHINLYQFLRRQNSIDNKSFSSSTNDEHYGRGFAYDVLYVKEMTCKQHDEPHIQDKWHRIVMLMERINCMLSVIHCQWQLLRAWKQFLQVYIHPKAKESSLTTADDKDSLHTWNRPITDRSQSTSSTDEVAAILQLGQSIETPPDSPAYAHDHAYSPHLDASSNQSPSSLHASTFVGDKRSYEMVTEIMTQMTRTCNIKPSTSSKKQQQQQQSMLDSYAWHIAADMSDLLLRMLHHQLRAIRKRTNDPRYAQVEYRAAATGNARLSSSRIQSLFQGIFAYCAYHNLPSASCLDDDDHVLSNEKLTIQLRLMTCLLLLVRSIEVHEYADDKQHEWLMIFQQAFHLALQTYQTWKQRSSSSKISARSQHHCQHYHTIIALLEVSTRLMKDALPDAFLSSVNPNLHHHTIVTWREAYHKEVMTMMTAAVNNFSSMHPRLCNDALHRYDASSCILPPYTYNEELSSLQASSSTKTSSKHPKKRLYSNPSYTHAYDNTDDDMMADDNSKKHDSDDDVDEGLEVASEYATMLEFLNALIQNRFLQQSDIIMLELFPRLSHHPILCWYQQALQQQESYLPLGLYFAYDARTGDEAWTFQLWDRCLDLVITICQSYDMQADDDRSNIADEVLHGMKDFCQHFTWLISYPLRSMQRACLSKLSMMQIRTANKTLLAFLAMAKNIAAFKAMIPTLYHEMKSCSYAVLQYLCYLLWEGEDYDEYRHQEYVLYATGAPVSEVEVKLASTSTLKHQRPLADITTSKLFRASSTSASHPHEDHHSKLKVKDLPADEDVRMDMADAWNSSIFARRYEEELLNFFANLSSWICYQLAVPIEGHQSSHPYFPSLRAKCENLPVGSNVFYSKTIMSPSSTSSSYELSASRAAEQIEYPANIAVHEHDDRGHHTNHTDMLLQGIIIRTRYEYSPKSIDILLPDGTHDIQVEVDDVRSTSFPIIQFHPLLDLSTTAYPWYHAYRHFINMLQRKLQPTTSSSSSTATVSAVISSHLPSHIKKEALHFPKEHFVTTTCMLKSLQYAVSSITAQRLHASSNALVSGDLYVLAWRLTYLILCSCTHHARFIMNGKLYSWPVHFLIAQLEDLQNIIQGRGILLHEDKTNHTSNINATSQNRSLDFFTPGYAPIRSNTRSYDSEKSPEWMMRDNWRSFVAWVIDLSNQYLEELRSIAGSPMRGGDPVYWKTPHRHELPPPESKSKPKKLGLRSAVQWVASPNADM